MMLLVVHIAPEISHVRIFFFNDTATTEIYTLPLHDALPIYAVADARHGERLGWVVAPGGATHEPVARTDREEDLGERGQERHDAPGGRGERHPTPCVVGDSDAALEIGRASCRERV